ncbi:30S ribosomal protein S7 [Candidatus Johnevansia muelleri]|uniref:Small ribosomal subunit protein uS7 n=1 Tax=Candidatus Johnevansia muelleri TaxID=1495769 RepID=A0A078KDS8_9GAMM|nr:30S ribosomal protein S7 [Candidatus Evansia muelleri]
MSRRRRKYTREILHDPKFQNLRISKFINHLMIDGKKSVAQKIIYSVITKLEGYNNIAPLNLFEKSIDTIKPFLEVKSRKVGGATYQIPVEVHPERSETLAMRWIIESARSRFEKKMVNRLYNEIIDILENKGNAIKKRDSAHRMAEANKAFSHVRF